MARTKGKTEHAGAKNGGGAMWGRRAEVKSDSNKRRRAESKKIIRDPEGRLVPRRTQETFPRKPIETPAPRSTRAPCR